MNYKRVSRGWHTSLFCGRMSGLLLGAEEQRSSLDAGSFGETLALGGVLHRVLLQRREVNKTLSAPHALKLCLPRVHALVLGQVLALLEALVTAGALEWLFTRVDSSMAL